MSEPLPGWAARVIDLATIDEDELGALLDDAIDNDQNFAIHDSRESDHPLAVILPWSRYARLVALQHGVSLMDKALGQGDE